MELLEEKLIARLLADAGVAALASSRIWYDKRESAIVPCAVISMAGADNHQVFGRPAGIKSKRFSFECYAQTSLEARALASQIQQCLEAWKEKFPDGLKVFGAEFAGENGGGFSITDKTVSYGIDIRVHSTEPVR